MTILISKVFSDSQWCNPILLRAGNSSSRSFPPVMDTRNMSDARVSIKSTMNGHTVEAQPLPNLDPSQLQGRPRGPVQDEGGRSSRAPSAAVSLLLPVEGLRAYLALWVLGSHALWVAGYRPDALV